MKQTHKIVLEKDLWLKLKEYAQYQRISISDLIERVLEQYIQEKEDYLRTDR